MRVTTRKGRYNDKMRNKNPLANEQPKARKENMCCRKKKEKEEIREKTDPVEDKRIKKLGGEREEDKDSGKKD
jgi:hypothetical protein